MRYREGELRGRLALSPVTSASGLASLLETGDKDRTHLVGWLLGFNENPHEERLLNTVLVPGSTGLSVPSWVGQQSLSAGGGGGVEIF